MKKSSFIYGIVSTMIGFLFILLAFRDTPLQSLFCGLAGGGIGPGLFTIVKYMYWSRPKQNERYLEKIENEQIDLHDERKQMLRGKTACYLHAYTLAVLCISILMFQVLHLLSLIESGKIIIIYLGFLFFSELVLSRLLFRWLEKKY